MRLSASSGLWIVLAGCRALSVGTSPPEPTPESAVTTTDDGIERFAIRKGGAQSFGALQLAARNIDADDAFTKSHATLEWNDGTRAFGAPGGVCVRDRGFVYMLEAIEDAKSRRPIAKFARMTTTAPQPVAEGTAVLCSPRDTLRAADGSSIWIPEVAPTSLGQRLSFVTAERNGQSRELWLRTRPDGVHTTLLDATRLLVMTFTDERDLLGCPVLSVTIERHDELVVDVTSGAEVELEVGHGARVGGVVVGYRGWGERMIRNGPAHVWASLDFEVDGRHNAERCRFGGSCEYAGYTVEVLDATPTRARLRISHR